MSIRAVLQSGDRHVLVDYARETQGWEPPAGCTIDHLRTMILASHVDRYEEARHQAIEKYENQLDADDG